MIFFFAQCEIIEILFDSFSQNFFRGDLKHHGVIFKISQLSFHAGIL